MYLQSAYTALFQKIGIVKDWGTGTVTKVTGPAVPPSTSIIMPPAFTADGAYAVVGTLGGLLFYKITGGVWSAYTEFAIGRVNWAEWSPDGVYLAVTHNTAPFFAIYKRTGDTLAAIASPSTLPTGAAGKSAWHPNGNYLAVTHAVSPFVTIYSLAADVLTKIANPATLPSAIPSWCAFCPDGSQLVIASGQGMFFYSGDGAFTAQNFSSMPFFPSSTMRLVYTQDSKYLLVLGSGNPCLMIFQKIGTRYLHLPLPADQPFSGSLSNNNVILIPGSNYFMTYMGNYPFISLYDFSGGYAQKIKLQDSLMTARSNATSPGYISASPDGKTIYLSASNYTSLLEAYVPIGFNESTEFAVPKITPPAGLRAYVKT